MGILEQQLQSIESELDLLIVGEDNRRIIDELDQAIEDLAPTQSKLEDVITISTVLQKAPEIDAEYQDDGSEADQLEKVTVAFTSMQEGWSIDSSTFRQKGLVGNFVESAVPYIESIEKKNTEIWNSWVQELELKFRVLPAELVSVRSVTSNRLHVENFIKHKEHFKEETKEPTVDFAKITRISELSNRLHVIKKDINFDYPKSVVDFFDEINRFNVFPLSKVGPELLVWLTENDALKDLEIKFKIR